MKAALSLFSAVRQEVDRDLLPIRLSPFAAGVLGLAAQALDDSEAGVYLSMNDR